MQGTYHSVSGSLQANQILASLPMFGYRYRSACLDMRLDPLNAMFVIANFLARILQDITTKECRDAVVSLASLSGVEDDTAVGSFHSMICKIPYTEYGNWASSWSMWRRSRTLEASAQIEPPCSLIKAIGDRWGKLFKRWWMGNWFNQLKTIIWIMHHIRVRFISLRSIV